MSAGRALVIAPRLPEFDRESGLLRVSDLIDMLLAPRLGGDLRLPADPDGPGAVLRAALEQRGVETHAPLESLDSIRDAERVRARDHRLLARRGAVPARAAAQPRRRRG